MRVFATLVALLLAVPAAAQEEEVGGFVQGEEGRIEVLPEPPPVGQELRLKEGWIRVESAPEKEAPSTGSFGVVRSRPAPTPPPAAEAAPPPDEEAPAARAERPRPRLPRDRCLDEKNEYLRALFEIAEIHDIEDPVALLSQLEQLPGLSAHVRVSIFGLPTAGPVGPNWIDPVRPLGWDEDLQAAAAKLEECGAKLRDE